MSLQVDVFLYNNASEYFLPLPLFEFMMKLKARGSFFYLFYMNYRCRIQ